VASLFKRGKNYYAQFESEGRKRQLSLRTPDRRRARKLLLQLEAASDDGRWDPLSDSLAAAERRVEAPKSLRAEIDAFLDSRQLLRVRTQGCYSQVLHLYEGEGLPLERFLAKRSPVTRMTYLRHIRVFYRWTVRQGWRDSDPSQRITLPRTPTREAHYFKRKEISGLVDLIREDATEKERLYLPTMIEFVCQSGLRLGEVCNAQWDWIEGDYLVFRASRGFTPKSGRDERVFLTPDARGLLDQLARDRSRLFFAPAPMQVSKRFLHWRRKAGLDRGSFHNLRHTCAAWMAMSGASAFVIKQHLRHSSLAVTERYMHLSNERAQHLITSALVD
jgi:integrase